MALKGGIGKKFESFIFDELKVLQTKKPLFAHRFVDSHDAGRFVSPQPSDFLLATQRSGTVYLEAKSSEVYLSLADAPSDMISPQQIGKMTLLERAEQPIYCLFYSTITEDIELWRLNGAIRAITDSNHLDIRYRISSCKVENVGALLEEVFL